MSTEHPITPPPELVQQWYTEADDQLGPYYVYIATRAARWGADAELEACVDQLRRWGFHCVENLRNVRRPKPPSLAEEALALINHGPENQPFLSEEGIATIRAALERLQELEGNG